MQTLIQVVCTKKNSLRDAIVRHKKIADFGLQVSQQKRQGRKGGWAKIHSKRDDRRGALNLEWNASTKILNCRVINRGKGRPNLIVGDFVDYLLSRFHRRVMAINIIPR
jgi:hypothetical protein